MNKRPIASTSSQQSFQEPDMPDLSGDSARPALHPNLARTPTAFAQPRIAGSAYSQQSALDEQDALDPDHHLMKRALGSDRVYQSIVSIFICFVAEVLLLLAIVFLHQDRWLYILLLLFFGAIKSFYAARPLLQALGLRRLTRYLILYSIPIIGSFALLKLCWDSHKMMRQD